MSTGPLRGDGLVELREIVVGQALGVTLLSERLGGYET